MSFYSPGTASAVTGQWIQNSFCANWSLPPGGGRRFCWSTWRRGKSERTWPRCWGAMLVSRMGLAALSRTDVREKSRREFYVYLDEFQSFTTLSLANMLSELRKYRVGLILAHQYLSQLDLQVRDAILGNVGTIISFRLGLADAEILENEFRPEISALDLISLPNYNIYLKLMIEGKVSRTFSGETVGSMEGT